MADEGAVANDVLNQSGLTLKGATEDRLLQLRLSGLN